MVEQAAARMVISTMNQVSESESLSPGQIWRFYTDFWAVWRWSAGLVTVLAAAVWMVGWMQNESVQPLYLAGLIPTVSLLLSLVVSASPVTLNALGIHGQTFFGQRRFVAWDDVQELELKNLFGLRYLRLAGTDGESPLWLPLFWKRPDAFAAAVHELAGASHPCTTALEQSGFLIDESIELSQLETGMRPAAVHPAAEIISRPPEM